MANIIIIDDDPGILQVMRKLCERMGHSTAAYQTGREGMAAIGKIIPDLLIVDLRLGDMDGLQIVRRCHAEHPGIAIIMVTGYGSVETAVEAMKLGAFDYLTKPFELEDLQRTINRAIKGEGRAVASDSGSPEADPSPVECLSLIGESRRMREIHQIVEKIADIDSPVLLEGEFGSGKQMVARSIHNRSRRNALPFKVLDCSSLPEDLLEMELFGLASGRGETIFKRAAGGSVFVEEINVLPMRLQSQLEGYLEDLALRRMTNSLQPGQNVRFIASSNMALDKEVAAGRFREDLYYKLSVIPIQMPSLRNRRDDIPLLIEYFLQRYAEMANSKVREVDRYAMEILCNYTWPGNVSELQNTIERACAFAEGAKIRPVDLPTKITQKVEISDDENEQIKHKLPVGTNLSDFIKKQEKMFIRETLKYNEGSREKTASMLGVSIATLYRKMGLKLERDKMLSA